MGEARVDYHTDPDKYVASFCRIGGHETCQTRGIFRCACACHQQAGKDHVARGAVHRWLSAHKSSSSNGKPKFGQGENEASSGGT